MVAISVLDIAWLWIIRQENIANVLFASQISIFKSLVISEVMQVNIVHLNAEIVGSQLQKGVSYVNNRLKPLQYMKGLP